MSTTVPFTMLEEAVYHIERTYTPWNVQFEVETATRIDVDRLREAALAAVAAHPLARASRRQVGGLRSRYVWEIPDGVDEVPVSVATPGDDPDLVATRTRFFGDPFDLTDAPPFRLLVARGAGRAGADGDPDGDSLLVCASHVPVDGVGILRLVRSICRAYRGDAVEPDPVDLETSRSVLDDARPSSFAARAGLVGSAATRLRGTVDRPARVSEDGASDRLEWGFVHRSLGADRSATVVEGRPDGASVNDVLLAALHLAIDGWNREHGDEPDTISTMMPVNVRPREWFYEVVGMYTLFESVTTGPGHRRSPEATLERVVEQTTAIKRDDRATAFLESLDLIPSATPLAVRRLLPELLRGPGRGLLDTAMLSNLGRVPDPAPSLTDDGPEELWFSPPCWEPTPLGIGVATVDGKMQLVFRHMFTTMDRRAAGRFADRFEASIDRVVEQAGTAGASGE